MSAGTVRVTLECLDSTGLIAWAKGFLEEEGYVVARPDPLHTKESVQHFCTRIGIHLGTFSRKIRLPKCPQNFECDRGPSGRFIWLCASKELEEFMKPMLSAPSESSA